MSQATRWQQTHWQHRHAVGAWIRNITGILSSARGDLPVDSAALIKPQRREGGGEKVAQKPAEMLFHASKTGLCAQRPHAEERCRTRSLFTKRCHNLLSQRGPSPGRDQDLSSHTHTHTHTHTNTFKRRERVKLTSVERLKLRSFLIKCGERLQRREQPTTGISQSVSRSTSFQQFASQFTAPSLSLPRSLSLSLCVCVCVCVCLWQTAHFRWFLRVCEWEQLLLISVLLMAGLD